jgi:23S rRNA-/tRNA-specific pseudouridylate synthase
LESPEIFPVHRLDKSVSGVLVFSKSKESAKVIGKAFEGHKVGRIYLAVVNKGDMEVGKDGTIDAKLRTSEDRVYRVQEGEEGVFFRCRPQPRL